MIEIGLTSFKEHGHLLNRPYLTLNEYASLFPVVEMNTSFYGIKPANVSENWVKETPDSFQFIVKAFKGMTMHAEMTDFYQDTHHMDEAFHAFLSPLRTSGKLGAVLCQFPSYFDCTKKHVAYLRELRSRYPDDMLAIELRNSSWYEEKYLNHTINFMRELGFSLVIVDQPQVPIHSVPFVPMVTNDDFVYTRLHGRNKGNWRDNTGDWRRKRNLYRYSEKELREIGDAITALVAKNQVMIFNNNSGGDAGDNALMMKQHLGIEYRGLNPKQTSLF